MPTRGSVGQPLCFRQVGRTSHQSLVGPLALGHIGPGAAITTELSVGVKHRLAASLDVHWRAVAAHDAIHEVTEGLT